MSLRDLDEVSTIAPLLVPGRSAPLGEAISGGLLAEMAPGAGLAAILDGVDVGEVDAFTAVEVVAALKRLESWAGAGAAMAAAKLATKPEMSSDGHPANPMNTIINGTAEELAMRLGVTRGEGARMVQVGQGLQTTFTDTAAAVQAGVIDLRKATTIVTTLWDYPDAVAWCAEQEVLERAAGRTGNQLTRDLVKALIAVDPDEAARRHKKALRRQHVTHPRALPDGMSTMYVVGGAEDTVPLDLTLTAYAQAAKTAGDSRSTDELRAEALFTLAAGALTTGWVGPVPGTTSGACTCTADDHAHRAPTSSDGTAATAATGATAGAAGTDMDADTHEGVEVAAEEADPDGDDDTPDRLAAGVHSRQGAGQGKAPDHRSRAGASPNVDPGGSDDHDVPDQPPDSVHEDQPPGTSVTPVPAPERSLATPGGATSAVESGHADISCTCTGDLGDDRLPPLHLLVRPRKGMRLGNPTTNRTQVRLTLPLSVAMPPAPQSPGADAAGADTTSAVYDVPPAEVAELSGYGPITPDVARAIALGGTWRRIVTDALTGAVLDVGRTRYRPPDELAEHVRQRDRTCVQPTCSVPAERCQLDHNLSWSLGGETADVNLGPLCVRDHQLKSSGLFHLTQPSPGVFEWTTPSGHAYHRAIDGTVTPLTSSRRGHDVPPF
ncbi:HNH endonuclease signature motif containing protein [Georgenia sp. SYP-B2076]|uniref:HNH endonuclease n=1 Tax=Georgenia sp. SYP-B2076 TaxID=2495881 RepID=UPI000F8E8828|nr:HNH endonuclease signature motif containing protein [Georgenia sp. SYP-B2076]